jgi:hypothetical protein
MKEENRKIKLTYSHAERETEGWFDLVIGADSCARLMVLLDPEAEVFSSADPPLLISSANGSLHFVEISPFDAQDNALHNGKVSLVGQPYTEIETDVGESCNTAAREALYLEKVYKNVPSRSLS